MTGNVLNFCFNNVSSGEKFATNYLKQDDGTPIEWDGAFGMWACLKKALENDDLPDILDATVLAELTLEEAESIFNPSNGVSMPMLEKRVELLNDTGEVLCEQYNGSFATLVNQSNNRLYNDGSGFVEQLVDEFKGYQDEWQYDGISVRFDKRAQLAATMLYDWFAANGQTLFSDIEDLTVFADYGIPIVLRDESILTYHPGLAYIVDSDTVDVGVLEEPDYETIDRETRGEAQARKFDAGEYRALAEMVEDNGSLVAGSRAELEIRAATIEVGDLLMQELNDQRAESVYVPSVDFFLWNQRRDAVGNAHLTETTAY